MADDKEKKLTEADTQRIVSEAVAKAKAEAEAKATAEAEATAKAVAEAEARQKARAAVHTYALYMVQRQRITRNCLKVCRSCDAWTSTHLHDFGY
jgi:acyl-CoA hydrolase